MTLRLSEKKLDKFIDTLEELDKEQLKLLWYWAVLKWAYLWEVDVKLGRF